MRPRVLILRTAGTNGDRELAHGFHLAGAEPEAVHLNRLIGRPELLESFELLGLPGGFSYGDDISAGKILANRLKHRLAGPLGAFIRARKPVIGICNGFQVLLKSGLLPGFEPPEEPLPPQTLTLTENTVPRFVDRWCGLRTEGEGCVWTRGLGEMELPVAHGEGRLVGPDVILDRLEANGQAVLRYTDNPNGSMREIAGICDPSGLVLGLMPHPERFAVATHHPEWTRCEPPEVPPGRRMLINAVEHVREGAGVATSGAG